MKLYAPKYYKDFVCIADKCNHSCCVGWEIDIDEKTLNKYRNLSHGYAKTINESIDREGTPHFRLAPEERCPHLDKNGLCRIILNLGEEYLCDICREHPRFYNNVCGGREVGLGMACEEACRIILNSDEYGIFIEVGEQDGESADATFDARARREKIYGILSDDSLSYPEKLRFIYGEFDISPADISDEDWVAVISSLEYLDESHKELFAGYSSEIFPVPEQEKQIARALAYFIFRHCTKAENEEEFRIALGFCLFCERLLASVIKSENAREISDIIPLARTISEEIEYSEDNTDAIMLEFSFL